MSTYIYYRCLSHDPPLIAEEESGQHYYDAPRAFELLKKKSSLTLKDIPSSEIWTSENVQSYFDRNSIKFLIQHPKCEIDLITEYGEVLTEDG